MGTAQDNIIIAHYMGLTVYPDKIPAKNKLGWKWSYKWKGEACDKHSFQLDYHKSWNSIIPVHRKINEIGLWMATNGYDKLWYEKGKEIDITILSEETPERSARLIANLITWYNKKQINGL